MEPHDLGIAGGVEQLLAYQIGGESRSGSPPEWRRFDVRDIGDLRILEETFAVLGSILLLLAILIRGTRARRVEKVTAAIVAAALLSPGVFAVAADRFPPREAALDFNLIPQDPQAFLAAQFGDDWLAWQWINANLPMDTILLTFEARLFYLERNVVFGSDHVLLPTYSMSLVDAVAFVRNLGVRDILDSPWSHNPDVNRVFWQRSVIFQNLDNRSFFQPIHTEGSVIVYAIVP